MTPNRLHNLNFVFFIKEFIFIILNDHFSFINFIFFNSYFVFYLIIIIFL